MPEISSPTITSKIELAAKMCAFLGVVFYATGLVIYNLRLQQYGHRSFDLADAGYVLTGVLFIGLAIVGYDFWMLISGCWKQETYYVGKPKPNMALRCLWTAVVIFLCGLLTRILTIYLQIDESENGKILVLHVYLIGLGAALDHFYIHSAALMTRQEFKFARVLDGGFSYFFISRSYPLGLCYFIYAFTIYPWISPSVGGGRLLQAEIFIKPSEQEFYRASGLPVTPSGSLGIWSIVAESNDGILITSSAGDRGLDFSKLNWNTPPAPPVAVTTLRLNKSAVGMVKTTKTWGGSRWQSAK